MNLISNAIKYCHSEKSPHISIRAEAAEFMQPEADGSEQLRKCWRIDVKDNGIGFEQRYAEKVFEVFQRLHQKDNYEGSGIGLAICRKIIQAHHGKIEVASEPGKGSVFSVYLPFS